MAENLIKRVELVPAGDRVSVQVENIGWTGKTFEYDVFVFHPTGGDGLTLFMPVTMIDEALSDYYRTNTKEKHGETD